MKTLIALALLVSVHSQASAFQALNSGAKKLESVHCQEVADLDAEPRVPKGSPMTVRRCSLDIKKVNGAYELTITKEDGSYLFQETAIRYEAPQVLKVNFAVCLYPNLKPMAFSCEGEHQNSLQSVVKGMSFGNIFHGKYQISQQEAFEIYISHVDIAKDFPSIKDCLPSDARIEGFSYKISSTQIPNKSCQVR